jgi:hypothetical protein
VVESGRSVERGLALAQVQVAAVEVTRVGQRVVPHRHSNVRPLESRLPDRQARDECHLAVGQHLHAMVGDTQKGVLKSTTSPLMCSVSCRCAFCSRSGLGSAVRLVGGGGGRGIAAHVHHGQAVAP